MSQLVRVVAVGLVLAWAASSAEAGDKKKAKKNAQGAASGTVVAVTPAADGSGGGKLTLRIQRGKKEPTEREFAVGKDTRVETLTVAKKGLGLTAGAFADPRAFPIAAARSRARSWISTLPARGLATVSSRALVSPKPLLNWIGPAPCGSVELSALSRRLMSLNSFSGSSTSSESWIWTMETPGCAVGVARDGRTPLSKAYGMADLEHDVPNTPETIFEAGSVSKQFTAAAILLLEQQGKLSIGDDVRKYVPELPDYCTPITIRHLMTHTSGLRDWGSVASIARR